MNKLSEFFKNKDISSKKLAQDTNIDISRIYDLFNNSNYVLSGEELYKLFIGLDLEINELINGIFETEEIENSIINVQNLKQEKFTKFGKWLKPLIINQKEISIATGIEQSRLSKLIINSSTKISAKELIKICKYLKQDIAKTLHQLYDAQSEN